MGVFDVTAVVTDMLGAYVRTVNVPDVVVAVCVVVIYVVLVVVAIFAVFFDGVLVSFSTLLSTKNCEPPF